MNSASQKIHCPGVLNIGSNVINFVLQIMQFEMLLPPSRQRCLQFWLLTLKYSKPIVYKRLELPRYRQDLPQQILKWGSVNKFITAMAENFGNWYLGNILHLWLWLISLPYSCGLAALFLHCVSNLHQYTFLLLVQVFAYQGSCFSSVIFLLSAERIF